MTRLPGWSERLRWKGLSNDDKRLDAVREQFAAMARAPIGDLFEFMRKEKLILVTIY